MDSEGKEVGVTFSIERVNWGSGSAVPLLSSYKGLLSSSATNAPPSSKVLVTVPVSESSVAVVFSLLVVLLPSSSTVVEVPLLGSTSVV